MSDIDWSNPWFVALVVATIYVQVGLVLGSIVTFRAAKDEGGDNLHRGSAIVYWLAVAIVWFVLVMFWPLTIMFQGKAGSAR